MACTLGNQAHAAYTMTIGPTRRVALGVERSSQQWVVRDPEGHVGLLPAVDGPWEQRQLCTPTPDTELEPVPGHDTSLLGLPFSTHEKVVVTLGADTVSDADRTAIDEAKAHPGAASGGPQHRAPGNTRDGGPW